MSKDRALLRAVCAVCSEPVLDGQLALYTNTADAKGVAHIRCLARVAVEDGLVIRVERRGVTKAGGTA